MARGNDGNLLQHSIEAELAARLLDGASPVLHLICTHSMAPFEPLTRSRFEKPDRRRRFERWWSAAKSEDRAGNADSGPAVLRAYRRRRTLEESLYPNSAEIVAALTGRESLTGVLVEKNPTSYQSLVERWRGTDMQPIQGSWRENLTALTAPADLSCPWLFTMDPFTYAPANELDDGDLHPRDFDLLLAPLRSWLNSGQRGAFCVFCYALKAGAEHAYRGRLDAFRESLAVPGLRCAFADVRFGASSHVGAILSRDGTLIDLTCERWTAVRDGDVPA